jgi:hypothetical protein
MAQNERVLEAVEAVARMVNTFGSPGAEFVPLMARQHRTLQQAFTKVCFQWLEYVGSEEYRTDLRNQAAHDVSKKLLGMFRAEMEKQYSGDTMDLMGKPSNWMQMI